MKRCGLITLLILSVIALGASVALAGTLLYEATVSSFNIDVVGGTVDSPYKYDSWIYGRADFTPSEIIPEGIPDTGTTSSQMIDNGAGLTWLNYTEATNNLGTPTGRFYGKFAGTGPNPDGRPNGIIAQTAFNQRYTHLSVPSAGTYTLTISGHFDASYTVDNYLDFPATSAAYFIWWGISVWDQTLNGGSGGWTPWQGEYIYALALTQLGAYVQEHDDGDDSFSHDYGLAAGSNDIMVKVVMGYTANTVPLPGGVLLLGGGLLALAGLRRRLGR